MNKKKLTAIVMAFILVMTAFTSIFVAFADTITWQYDSATKTLTVSGSGAMDDYTPEEVPWSAYTLQLEKVVVEEGVTTIGKNAFIGCSRLSDVSLADSVTTIGEYAFASCPMLQELTLNNNIISIKNNDVSFAYNGSTPKDNFVIITVPGSYALYYAYQNNLSFIAEDVKTGILHVSLQKGMTAYFPYTARYSGQYRFYSVSKHDTRGYLYSSAGTQLAYNDDHATGYPSGLGSTDFGLTFTLTKGEKYYLATNILNFSLKAKYDVYFEPVEYTVSGTLRAMANPSGDASDITLVNAYMDGVALQDGTFTKTVSGLSDTVTFTCDGVTLEHTFTVEDGDEIVLSMMMCDVNADGIVNAKDYAYLQQQQSPYLPLFENFINYTY